MNDELPIEPLPIDITASVPPARESWASAIKADILTEHSRNLERRARILKHPDLAQRLVSELGYLRADQWNGYVPPRSGQDQDGEWLHDTRGFANPGGLRSGRQQANDSWRRTVLVSICAEALAREENGVITGTVIDG
jgi:hypothetical protein